MSVFAMLREVADEPSLRIVGHFQAMTHVPTGLRNYDYCMSGVFDSANSNGLMLHFDKVWERFVGPDGIVTWMLHGTIGLAEASMLASGYDSRMQSLFGTPCCSGIKMKAAAEPQDDDEGPADDAPFKLADAAKADGSGGDHDDLAALEGEEEPMLTLVKPTVAPSWRTSDPAALNSGSSGAGESSSSGEVFYRKGAVEGSISTTPKQFSHQGGAFVARNLMPSLETA